MGGAGAPRPTPMAAADVLTFPVNDEDHALHLASVREVVVATPVSPVPGSPPWLLGVVNLRGDLVPVLDSGRALSDDEIRGVTHLVVGDTAAGPVALATGGTPKRRQLGDRAAAAEQAGTHGCFLAGDGVVTLLDLDAMTARR